MKYSPVCFLHYASQHMVIKKMTEKSTGCGDFGGECSGVARENGSCGVVLSVAGSISLHGRALILRWEVVLGLPRPIYNYYYNHVQYYAVILYSL